MLYRPAVVSDPTPIGDKTIAPEPSFPPEDSAEDDANDDSDEIPTEVRRRQNQEATYIPDWMPAMAVTLLVVVGLSAVVVRVL